MEEEKWISVKERLPESDGWYIVAYPEVYVSYFFVSPNWQGESNKFISENVTHWQPLPSPPKQ